MIKLSVIIPTRNRAETLLSTLVSIEKQTLDQSLYEVIVCDNNSTDNTSNISKSFEDKFINFQYIKTLEPGLHVGRNKGFQEARSEILVYVDDDIEAFPNWLFTINEVFQNSEVMLVGGKNLPKWEVPPPKWALEMWKPNKLGEHSLGWFSIIDLGNTVKDINPYLVWGCNFSVRKKIIVAAKGFHPDGMPQNLIEYRGDGESAISGFVKENKFKTVYHPDASVYHLVSKERLTINYLRKRGFSQGVSDSYTNIRSPKPIKIENVIFATSILKRTLFFLKSKLKRIITGTYKYEKAILTGYKEGYNFHQQKVKDNPDLLGWVLKEDYL